MMDLLVHQSFLAFMVPGYGVILTLISTVSVDLKYNHYRIKLHLITVCETGREVLSFYSWFSILDFTSSPKSLTVGAKHYSFTYVVGMFQRCDFVLHLISIWQSLVLKPRLFIFKPCTLYSEGSLPEIWEGKLVLLGVGCPGAASVASSISMLLLFFCPVLLPRSHTIASG